MKRSTPLFAFALSLFGYTAPVSAFARSKHQPRPDSAKSQRQTQTALQVFPVNLAEIGHAVSQHAPVITAGTAAPFFVSLLLGREQIGELFCDPFAEAEACGELSAVSEEVTLFVGESVLFSNVLNVLSKSFGMASKFLSNSMAPEQMLGQSLLLFTSLGQLSKSLDITRQANSREMTTDEVRAYKAYFGPSGLTFNQYKTLLVLSAEWISVEEGSDVLSYECGDDEESGEYLYWLYRGDVDVTTEANSYQISKVKGPRLSDKNNFCRMGLLGDLQFYRDYLQDCDSTLDYCIATTSEFTCRAGSNGAKFIRFNMPAIADTMKSDEQFEKSMKALIFKSVEDKAFAALA